MRDSLDAACRMVCDCFKNGGKVLTCGNGGSAADSGHIVGELVKGFLKKRPIPDEWQEKLGMPLQMGLPAIDLTAQSAVISATANDLGGDYVFAQQVMAYAGENDVLICISTSGNSVNVINAAKVAHVKGAKVIAMTGESGGKLAGECDILINVPEKENYRVQERHLEIYHRLCARVEAVLFDE